MYLHIGVNTYIWSKRIIGIFDASVFHSSSAHVVKEENVLMKEAGIVSQGIRIDEAKSYILTEPNTLYLSNIHCRTLEKRWKALGERHKTDEQREIF